MMTKSAVVARLCVRFPLLPVQDVEVAVNLILGEIAQRLTESGRVEIRGFGAFTANYRPPRTGRNPKSGELVQVREKHLPHFKAGKELRERVRGG